MSGRTPGTMPLADASRQIGAHVREIGRLHKINTDLLEALKGTPQYIILAIRQGLKDGLSEETLKIAETDLKAVTDAVKKADTDNA